MGMTRRTFLRTSAALMGALASTSLASRAANALPTPEPEIVEILATANEAVTDVYFDPIGIWVKPGTTIRWRLERSYHSTTAYHPANDNHELRIPVGAKPWDSGIMLQPGVSVFEVTLTVPGVYDYYCIPHEHAGMVGRIIVGEPVGPGANPFNYDPSQGWKRVPEVAQAHFPSVEQIMNQRVVRYVPK